MKKNVASQKVGCQMVSASDGSAFTGAVTVYVTLDAGTQAIGSVGGGACTHEGNGLHTYAPAQAETNGDFAEFTFIGTGAVPDTLHIYTGFPQTEDSYAIVSSGTFGNSALKTLIDTLDDYVDTEVAAIKTTTDKFVFTVANKVDSNVYTWNGTAVSVPATAGIPEVNVKNMNNVSAAAITTIKAVQGLAVDGVVPTVTAVTGLTAATVHADLDDIQARLPAALTAGGNIKADALALSGDTVAADNAESFFDGTGYAGTNNVIPLVTTTTTATTATNLTNAPTAGDFTAVMKTSIGTAVAASAVASVTGAVGSVTGNVGGNLLGTLTSTERNAISDALLTRNVSGGSSTGRTVKQALGALRNKVTISGGTLTVYDIDDTTPLWDATVTTTAGNPLSGIDPS